MEKKSFWLIITMVASSLYSCTSYCDEFINSDINLIIEENEILDENIVSIGDVHNRIMNDRLECKSVANMGYDIQPYIGENHDTLFYIVNFENNSGWIIYSSDKRTPAVLAEGNTGYFSTEDGSPAVSIWLDILASNMIDIRKSSNDELIFSEDEINYNKSFWSGEPQRVIHDSLIIELPSGHWEEEIYAQTEIFDSVDHLVAHWSQGAPYNLYCPYYVTTPDSRAVTGCVAIAGAQLLLYLHYKIGVPVYMYSSGYCTGNVNSYSKHFDNASLDVWDNMSTEYCFSQSAVLPEAIMISYVGHCVNMHYCDNVLGQYSWAVPANLKTDLFENLGITCSHDSYDESIVEACLLNQMPVIISASNQLVPLDGNIHCFVIDGYRRTRIKYTHYHYFVFDEIPTGPYAEPREYNTYTYSSPQLTNIKINWGWRSQWSSTPVNDGWYTLTSGWTVTVSGETFNYDRYVKMIYNFDELE